MVGRSKPISCRSISWGYIGAHQHLVANCQTAMHDLVLLARWSLVCHRRSCVAEDLTDSAVEAPLVEFKRGLALPIEV